MRFGWSRGGAGASSAGAWTVCTEACDEVGVSASSASSPLLLHTAARRSRERSKYTKKTYSASYIQ